MALTVGFFSESLARHQQLQCTSTDNILFRHRLMFSAASPLASLFFITLPPLVMLELMVRVPSSLLLLQWRTDTVPFLSPSACLSDYLCVGVSGHCASVQSSRKPVEFDD